MSTPYRLLPVPQKASFLHYADKASLIMTFTHNAFFRALNAMVYHAPRITADQVQDFDTFALHWTKMLDYHHRIEEECWFPLLEHHLGKGSLEKSVEQHHEFMPAVQRFEKWLKDLKSGAAIWDAAHFKSLVDDFAPALVHHLNAEIGEISPDKIAANISQADHDQIEMKVGIKTKEQGSGPDDLAFFLSNHPLNCHPESAHFPPAPPAALQAARGPIWQANAKWLAFGVCDSQGQLKPVPIA